MKGPEVKPEAEPKIGQMKGQKVKPDTEPKLNHTGTNQKPTGSEYNAWVDQNSYKEEVNLSLQIEKLATMTTQDKFLNGARINDSDGVIIRLEKAVIDDPDFYAAWGWINMKAICLSLMTNLYSQPYNLTSLTRTQNPQEVTGFSYTFFLRTVMEKGNYIFESSLFSYSNSVFKDACVVASSFLR